MTVAPQNENTPTADAGTGADAIWFVTMLVNGRRNLLGEIAAANVQLTPLGAEVRASLRELDMRNPGLSVLSFVVMPDHAHALIRARAKGGSPRELLDAALFGLVSWTGRAFAAQAGSSRAATAPCADAPSKSPQQDSAASQSAAPGQSGPSLQRPSRTSADGLWQKDIRVMRCSPGQVDAMARYITYNPLKSELLQRRPEYLRIREPLDAPRLPADGFWRGIGNVGLLSPESDMKVVSIPRKSTQAQISELEKIARVDSRRRVWVSGWETPGEKAVREILLANPAAGIVQLLPFSMPHEYTPSNVWLAPLHAGRALIIARGNDDRAPAPMDAGSFADLLAQIAQGRDRRE